jgi:hypothetical protein
MGRRVGLKAGDEALRREVRPSASFGFRGIVESVERATDERP